LNQERANDSRTYDTAQWGSSPNVIRVYKSRAMTFPGRMVEMRNTCRILVWKS